jgi:hypothetical protein
MNLAPKSEKLGTTNENSYSLTYLPPNSPYNAIHFLLFSFHQNTEMRSGTIFRKTKQTYSLHPDGQCGPIPSSAESLHSNLMHITPDPNGESH